MASEPFQLSRLAGACLSAGVEPGVRATTVRLLAAAASEIDTVVIYHQSNHAGLLEAIRDAKEAVPEHALIAVSPEPNLGEVRRSLRAGALGVVSELELVATLRVTIDAVRSGLTCVPRAMRRPLESEALSMREKQILGLLVQGLSNCEIAASLYLAETTVKSHLSSAYAKLGVTSRRQAISMILDPAEGLGPGILAIPSPIGAIDPTAAAA